MKPLLKHLLDFIFPPFCLHCSFALDGKTQLLCPACLEQMELIDPAQRCRYCFGQELVSKFRVCNSCLHHRPIWHRAASVFEHRGAARCIIHAMKNDNKPYLARGLGAFMALQFLRLEWPLPDMIIPVPTTLARWIQRGYHPSLHLANIFGDIIKRPVLQALKRKSGDFSQTRLDWVQRKKLSKKAFRLSKRHSIEEKTLLLVDDLIATGATAECCTQILLEGFPKKIYILTVGNNCQGGPWSIF